MIYIIQDQAWSLDSQAKMDDDDDDDETMGGQRYEYDKQGRRVPFIEACPELYSSL